MDPCVSDLGTVCSALTKKKCAGCVFRRSAGQQMDSDEASHERLRALPDQQQDYIAQSYYRGQKPWQGKGRRNFPDRGNGKETYHG